MRNKKGDISQAVLELRYKRIRILPPIGKQKLYPELTLTVLHATKRGTPKDRNRIDWKLVTDIPVSSPSEATEKLRWYAMRWKIETFHKVLKSGFKAEKSKLPAAEQLVNFIAILCILSWRVFWITMLNRTSPEVAPEIALTSVESYLLDQLVADKPSRNAHLPTLSFYSAKHAQLGGYLARAKESPPEKTVIWRGLARLTDIQRSFILSTQPVGN